MPDSTAEYGEAAATTAQVQAWVTLVRSGRTASRGFKDRPGQLDDMRASYGSGRASSEGDPE